MSHGTTHTHGTPALRVLSEAGVDFAEHAYDHDDRAPAFGLEAAERLRVEPARVFKTIVVEAEPVGLGVVIVPVDARVDLKAAARQLGAKRATLAEAAHAQRATGYVVGGISPFGQRRALPTVLDSSASGFATIFVSAGRRGLDVELAPDDLVRLLDARVADVAAAPEPVA